MAEKSMQITMYVNKHIHVPVMIYIQNYSNEGYFTLKFNFHKVSSFKFVLALKKQTCIQYHYFGCHYVFPVTGKCQGSMSDFY